MTEKKELGLNVYSSDSNFATKSSPKAIILCTLLGYLGAHRFYTGYYLIGLFQMLTCGGFLLWFIIDMLQLFRNNFEDAKGNPLANYNKNNKLASGLCCLATILGVCWGGLCLNEIDKFRTRIITSKSEMKLNSVEQARKTRNQEDVQEAETIEEEMNRKIFSKKGISIIKHNPCVDSKGNNNICGTIVNSTTSPAKNITIKIELYDGNKNFIAFTEAKIYHLEAKTKFDFQAPVFYDTAVDYKIIKISSN